MIINARTMKSIERVVDLLDEGLYDYICEELNKVVTYLINDSCHFFDEYGRYEKPSGYGHTISLLEKFDRVMYTYMCKTDELEDAKESFMKALSYVAGNLNLVETVRAKRKK